MNKIHRSKKESLSKPKRKRKVLSLHKKCEILDRLRKGETITAVSRCYELNESSVRTIKRYEEAIRRSVASSSDRAAKIACKPRNSNLEKAEKALSLWIEHQTLRKIPLSCDMMRSKMMTIYQHIVANSTSNMKSSHSASLENFRASKGWFENFKRRNSLHSIKNLLGETETSQADTLPAQTFEENLKNLITNEHYHPEQVFNAVEMNLFWKRIPLHPILSNGVEYEPGFNLAKERVTVLISSNATGECILKPLVLHQSHNVNLSNYENDNKNLIFLRSNEKPWVTGAPYMDWIRNCFLPSVKSYLKEKQLFFKVILLLDSSVDHKSVEELQNCYPNIKVLYFPSNNTSTLQTLNEDIKTSFKSFYLLKMLSIFYSEMQNDNTISLTNWWMQFSIVDCIAIINEFLNEHKSFSTKPYWTNIWPNIFGLLTINNLNIMDKINQILFTAQQIGTGTNFESLNKDAVEEFLNTNDEELTEEELVELSDNNAMDIKNNDENEESISNEDHNEENLIQLNNCLSIKLNEEKPKKTLSLKEVKNIIRTGNKLKELVCKLDTQEERVNKFKKDLDIAMRPYTKLQKTLLDLIRTIQAGDVANAYVQVATQLL